MSRSREAPLLRKPSALTRFLPEDVRLTGRVIQNAGEYEEKVGKAVEVMARGGIDRFALTLRERDKRAFGTAADRSGQMGQCCGTAAAWQDEFFQRSKGSIESVELGFEAFNLLCADHAAVWNAQLASQVEKLVLYAAQQCSQLFRQLFAHQEAQGSVQFIYVAHSLYSETIFGNALSVTQSCLPAVAGAGIDAAQSMSHDGLVYI